MYLSELPGKSTVVVRQPLMGILKLAKRCREMGVDTIIVFDTTGGE
ncbi:hypothetical protein KCP69_18735 [Salmonella enterica subsp. enterica]|nr:hypothetical protein KCP69_18735 [Salmonella enterica subsp. enterica]